MMDETAFKMTVTGRVTGVGFRFRTRREARCYPGLKGYVRNIGPGKVECLVQGRLADVRAMSRWLQEGPENARVDTFEVETLPVNPNLPCFDVRF